MRTLSVNAEGLAPCSKRDCLSSCPHSQDANHLSHPVRLGEDDPAGDRLHFLRITCDIEDRQIGKALAVGPRHGLAVGSRQAYVGQ
jgi:hypothetical protein